MRMPILLIVAMLAFSHGAVGISAESPASRPNVLFLICDDLNCDLGCYGHPLVQSPHIDRLAQRGVRFANAHCQYPLCGPSRASFMTGLYPDQTLIHRNAVYVRQHIPNVKTLPQMFRDAGYFATRIGKIYHYGVPRHIGTAGHDDPFSWNYTINPRGRDKDDEHLVFSLRPGSFGGTLSWLAADGEDGEQTDGIAATEAIALLENLSQNHRGSLPRPGNAFARGSSRAGSKKYASFKRPFFLAVGLYRPHTPYVAPKKYFSMYPREKIDLPTVPNGYLDTLPQPARRSLTRKKEQVDLPDSVARQVIQAYHASITFADAQVGRILDALDATGLADNTIVLFTSDHGYHMGEHGYWQKTTLFENATHVPLIIAGPGIRNAGRRTEALAEMVDFYPTLAELCGLRGPDCLSGVSLAPALTSSDAEPRQSALTQYENGYSIRTSRYRYTEWGPEAAKGAELYDHPSDPGELNNLADRAEHAETVARLSKRLRQRVAEAKQAPKGLQQFDVLRRPRDR